MERCPNCGHKLRTRNLRDMRWRSSRSGSKTRRALPRRRSMTADHKRSEEKNQATKTKGQRWRRRANGAAPVASSANRKIFPISTAQSTGGKFPNVGNLAGKQLDNRGWLQLRKD